MAKLQSLQPMVRPIGERVTRLASGEERPRDHQPWRRWYKLARWQKLRWACLVRDAFTCGFCKAVVADTSQLVADHRRPHRGDPRLFWDIENLQCLCKQCHDSTKQRIEAGDRGVG